MEGIFEKLAQSVIEGRQKDSPQLVSQAFEEGISAEDVLNKGLLAGMEEVGRLFKAEEYYVPEVLLSARAMRTAMEVLRPALVKSGVEPKGKVALGTVKGDLHDIGKNLVAMMLKGAGFEVVDLGVDIGPERFVEQAKAAGAQIIGMSALLTTTMPAMEKTIQALKESGVSAKIMVGGAPVTQGYAERIGAHGYAPDAATAVDVAKNLVA